MLKLIVEDDRDLCKATIVESTEEERKDGKYHPLKVRGIFAKADYVNKNKRTYPYEMLKKEFDRFIEEDVKPGRAFGEFEHPAETRKSEAEEREHAAIFINEVTEDPKNKVWIGEATIMASDPSHGIHGTPYGDCLAAHYQYSGNKNLCGFSTRGYGDLSKEDSNGVKSLI